MHARHAMISLPPFRPKNRMLIVVVFYRFCFVFWIVYDLDRSRALVSLSNSSPTCFWMPPSILQHRTRFDWFVLFCFVISSFVDIRFDHRNTLMVLIRQCTRLTSFLLAAIKIVWSLGKTLRRTQCYVVFFDLVTNLFYQCSLTKFFYTNLGCSDNSMTGYAPGEQPNMKTIHQVIRDRCIDVCVCFFLKKKINVLFSIISVEYAHSKGGLWWL